MNIFHIFIIITLAEHCRASSKQGEEVKPIGIVKEMTPEGTVLYPRYLVRPAIWIEEKPSEMLKFSCYAYFFFEPTPDREIYEYRLSVQTKLEGIEIENYVVTGCPDSNDTPLMQYTVFTKKEKGYEYKTFFKDGEGDCYRRTYTTEHGDFTTSLTRGEAQPTPCSDEEVSKTKYIPEARTLQAGVTRPQLSEDCYRRDDQLLIVLWSPSGTFDASISEKDVFPGEGSLNSWTVRGLECVHVTLSCRIHRKFYTNKDIFVADIYAGVPAAPLDRIVVTSCERQGIISSFKCVKQVCGLSREECNYTIMYRNEDGTCQERSYKYDILLVLDARGADWQRVKTRLRLERFGTKPAQCNPNMLDEGFIDYAIKHIKGAASTVGGWFRSRDKGNN